MNALADLPMTDIETLKALGRLYLAAQDQEKALQTYALILQQDPDDVESHLCLGDLYFKVGDEGTAVQLYSQALRLEPYNPDILQRIQEATQENNNTLESGEPVPTHPLAIARLLQRLTGRSAPIQEDEIDRAAMLLEKIIHSPDPAAAVSCHLYEIDSLLPALIELNIRQAQADGRPDLASALKDLQTNVRLQKDIQSAAGSLNQAPVATSTYPERCNILFLTPEKTTTSQRCLIITEALESKGAKVNFVDDMSEASGRVDVDLVIACNPHSNHELIECLGMYSARKIPVIVDLDADYEQIPVTHPFYPLFGLSTPAHSKAYVASLLLADTITVSSETLLFRLKAAGYPKVEFVPDGWSKKNALWDKPAYPHHSLNLGWISGASELEDLIQIRRVIIRVMREFPQIQWIVYGDPRAYQLFDSIPEPRRLYLPPVTSEDYPYMLGQIDILLAPFRNIPFNRSISDLTLVEAGARRIPWIASPVPSFTKWQVGGLIANSVDEWHTYLRQLVLDADLRDSLCQNGRLKAEERESKKLGLIWKKIVEKAFQPKSVGKKEHTR